MTLEGMVPFPPEFAERYRARGYWQDRPLGEVFAETFARFADRIALVAGQQRISYRQLGERVERLALHLLEGGIKPLDPVVVQLPNVPEFIYLYFALQRIGAIPVMALPAHRYIEISHFVRLTGAVGYALPARLGAEDMVPFAERIREENDSLRLILLHGPGAAPGFESLAGWLETESGLSPDALSGLNIDPSEPACFQLTGGTTGVPKVIPRTHNDYHYNFLVTSGLVGIEPDSALLVVLPIAHNFALASPGVQGFLLRGARLVLTTETGAAQVLPLVARERVTHLELVPALLISWLNDPAIDRHDLSSLRVLNSGGQKLQTEVKRRAKEMIPDCIVQEVFGMAEGLLMFVRLDDPEEVWLETVGRPVCPDDEVKLLDESGRDVAPGEVGEMACRGPYTLRGYFRAPEQNAQDFTSDGFFKTGDLMRLHPSGNYVVEGRRKDLINRGGEKISAEEVENLILSHPAVKNVACVPMPDPVLGERMCAYLVPQTGATVTLAEITAFALEKGIAKFKLPERLELLDELPTSGFGKISKKTLMAWIAEKLKEEQAP